MREPVRTASLWDGNNLLSSDSAPFLTPSIEAAVHEFLRNRCGQHGGASAIFRCSLEVLAMPHKSVGAHKPF
jgi:hypothetical protein